MNISTSYTSLSNTDLSLKSGPVSAVQIKIQNDVSDKVQSNSEPVVALSPQSPSELPQNVSPTYAKPVAGSVEFNSQIIPENEQPSASSQTSDESTNHTDDGAGRETTSETDPTDEQNSTQSASQTEHHDKPYSEYSEEELALIDSLQLRETEVEAHERAHATVGGQYAGSPSYSYKTGPDGVKYAVSGEVSIDTSPVSGDPQASLQKAKQIKAAALAPAEPSSQDIKVAAKADQMATQARNEILAENANDSSAKDANGNSHKSASQPNYGTSVPEHFNGQESLSASNMQVNRSGYLMDNETQIQMQDRNLHINELYQNSDKILASSHLNIQA
jgi:hypothetical protein